MPDPRKYKQDPESLKVAARVLVIGFVIAAFKFGVFFLTNSVAVLSDALDSIINVVAASVMLYSIWYSTRPPDETHPYGHGKVEFLAIGFEGWMILFAGITIIWTAIERFITGTSPRFVGTGLGLLFAIGLLSAGLAWYTGMMGKKLNNDVLAADGKHLMTDVVSTFAVLVGLVLVKATGWFWLDPLIALVVGGFILSVSWRLLWQSIDGLMDKSDPHDLQTITDVLDEQIKQGRIRSYHKVRSRHMGDFHWIDMHLQVEPSLSVADSHALASQIEHRVEGKFEKANATAHIEPAAEGEACKPDADAPCPSETSADQSSDQAAKQNIAEAKTGSVVASDDVVEALEQLAGTSPETDTHGGATETHHDKAAEQSGDDAEQNVAAKPYETKGESENAQEDLPSDNSFKPPQPGA